MISVRRMTGEDIAVSQRLLSQLGYPLDTLEVRQRYDAVAASKDHSLMVAEQARRVVALCHVYVRPALDKPPEAIVQALIVGHASCGSGIGTIMMAAAEAWARDRGLKSVALASNVMRTGAHSFYEDIGYQRAATSHLFRKTLD